MQRFHPPTAPPPNWGSEGKGVEQSAERGQGGPHQGSKVTNRGQAEVGGQAEVRRVSRKGQEEFRGCCQP